MRALLIASGQLALMFGAIAGNAAGQDLPRSVIYLRSLAVSL